MKSIREIKDLKGKIVLIRVDFNVPIKDGEVQDDFRIKKALPIIKFFRRKKAKIILISHLGKGEETLAPVAEKLNKFIRVSFISKTIGSEVKEIISKMKNREIILLENLRNNFGEQANEENFAQELASLAYIYVNEAFSVSHREDASIVSLPKFLPSYIGLQFEAEIKNLSIVFQNPLKPFLFILGGAKFSTKIPLVQKYLELADQVFIGGALANDFLKAKGIEIGNSLVGNINEIGNILENKKIILPIDFIVEGKEGKQIGKVNEVKKDEIIIDLGPETISLIKSFIKKSKLVLWNGPLGKYENGGDQATKETLKALSKSKTKSIIGGGDIVAVISELKLEKKFTFVSTGGGATLDFLANGTLPGIKALK